MRTRSKTRSDIPCDKGGGRQDLPLERATATSSRVPVPVARQRQVHHAAAHRAHRRQVGAHGEGAGTSMVLRLQQHKQGTNTDLRLQQHHQEHPHVGRQEPPRFADHMPDDESLHDTDVVRLCSGSRHIQAPRLIREAAAGPHQRPSMPIDHDNGAKPRRTPRGRGPTWP